MPTKAPAQPLMDNLEFLTELETMDGVPSRAVSPTQLMDRVREMEDGFVPDGGGARRQMPDRNTFNPTPIEDDEPEDETSARVSARTAAFAVMASGLAGAAAAVLLFHQRLALFR